MLKYLRTIHRIQKRNELFRRCCSNASAISSEWQKPDLVNAYDTGINVYNCVHKGNVPLIVRKKQCVTWYSCGPTVYDDAHIGHAVCYMKSDIIQRILRHYFHLNLITAMNITDIDNKIIDRSRIEQIPWNDLAKKYEKDFWLEMNALGIQKADIILRVSESIPKIIKFIEQLLENKSAYVASDGSVYFENKQSNGKLQNTLNSASETRTKLNATETSIRKSLRDFALWKCAKENEPQWDVPWKYENNESTSTAGRPGWHTECSAMATDLFGDEIDIHSGGIDLKFPHHENEEAQCCAYHKRKQWVNYWFHIGHLVTTDNVKMSKSLKNVITIKEFLKHYSRDQLRMVCLMSSYHQHVQFGDDIMLRAGDILKRFVSFFDDTNHYLKSDSLHYQITNRNEILLAIESAIQNIDIALKDDFDTKACIHHLVELVTQINKSINGKIELNQSNEHIGCGFDVIQSGQNVVRTFLEIFGITDVLSNAFASKWKMNDSTEHSNESNRLNVERLIDDFMELRSSLLNVARTTKNQQLFDVCDQMRTTLRKNHLIIKDRGANQKPSWHYDNVITNKNQTDK